MNEVIIDLLEEFNRIGNLMSESELQYLNRCGYLSFNNENGLFYRSLWVEDNTKEDNDHRG